MDDISNGALDEREHQVRKAFRKSGVKLTHQRIEIFREIVRSRDHPDAARLHRTLREKMPMISLDTVYRTLWLLVDLGLITTYGYPYGRLRFDQNLDPHHHFVCTRCGAVIDFKSDDLSRLRIPVPVMDLGNINSTHIEFRGVCSSCLRQDTETGNNARKEGI